MRKGGCPPKESPPRGREGVGGALRSNNGSLEKRKLLAMMLESFCDRHGGVVPAILSAIEVGFRSKKTSLG